MQNTMTRPETKKISKYMGMDVTSNDYREKVLAGARPYGEEAVAAAKKDIETAASWYSNKYRCKLILLILRQNEICICNSTPGGTGRLGKRRNYSTPNRFP